MSDCHLARNFRFAGIHSGLRPDPNRRDLALIVSDLPASAAGVFTQNRVCAAPVHVCRERLPSNNARGFVVCSGNANACTGLRGLDDARRMTAVAAECIDCLPTQLLVCSTGVIGRHLPMPIIESGIQTAARQLKPSTAAFHDAAQAILTTDTRMKVSTREIRLDAGVVRITGFAKGAAMIGPNMATMLAFVLTDAAVEADDLHQLARQSADRSFNCVSVEGHTSTNDTLLLFANGTEPKLQGGDLARYGQAVTSVCTDLAKEMAADAEGGSHFVTLDVEGLRNDAEARSIAKAVAESALVKTAIFGADPNWGRIVSAAGYAGVAFDEENVTLWLGDTLLYRAGTPQPFDPAAASAYLKNNRDIHIRMLFNLGSARCTMWTCDLTYDYVRLNADYTT